MVLLVLLIMIVGAIALFGVLEKLRGGQTVQPLVGAMAEASPPHFPVSPRPAARQRTVATAPWGAVLLECGVNKLYLFLLPIVDGEPYAGVAEFPPGIIEAVVVINTGDEGVLAGSLVARKTNCKKVFALDASRPIDRGMPVTDAVSAAPLPAGAIAEGTLTRVPEGARVDFTDGTRAVVGDMLKLATFFDSGADIIAGAVAKDVGGAGSRFDHFPKNVLLLRNVPGLDATRVAKVLSQLGISSSVAGPEDPERQVLALLTAGKLADAEQIARASIARGARRDTMGFQLGIAALMRGDEPAAIAAFEAAAEAGSSEACSSLAGLLARRGDRRALDFARRALDGLPGDSIALQAAIRAHVRLGDVPGARALFEVNRDVLSTGERVVVEAALEGKVELDPESDRFPAHAHLASEAAQQLRTEGKKAEAEAFARRAVELDRDTPEHVAELGTLLSELGRDAEAVTAYTAAIDRGGVHTLLRFNRGNCHLRAARYSQAAADYRACLEVKRDWHDVRVNLASALFAAKDLAGARAELQELKNGGADPRLISGVEDMLRQAAG